MKEDCMIVQHLYMMWISVIRKNLNKCKEEASFVVDKQKRRGNFVFKKYLIRENKKEPKFSARSFLIPLRL